MNSVVVLRIFFDLLLLCFVNQDLTALCLYVMVVFAFLSCVCFSQFFFSFFFLFCFTQIFKFFFAHFLEKGKEGVELNGSGGGRIWEKMGEENYD